MNQDELKVCPICKTKLFLRAELDSHVEGLFDELWECDNHHLLQAVYKLVEVKILSPQAMQKKATQLLG